MSTYVLDTSFPAEADVTSARVEHDNAVTREKDLAAARKAIADAATGKAIDKAQEALAAQEQVARAEASTRLAVLRTYMEMRAAGEVYRKNSPTIEVRNAAQVDLRGKTKKMKETAEALLNAENVLSSAKYQLTAATTPEYVTQAQANVAIAQTARDNAKIADDAAAKAFRDAKAHLVDLEAQMKRAEQAYEEAVKRAKPTTDDAVSGNGYGVGSPGGAGAGADNPGASTAGAPSKPGGPSKPAPAPAPATAPAAKPGGPPSGAAKPTTAAAPAGAAKTTESGSSKGSSDAALASVLANLRAQGQTSQTGQGQPASAAPAAAAPSTGAGTGKPVSAEDGQGGQGGGLGRPWDVPDLAAAAGVTSDWINGKSAPTAAPTTTPAPATAAAPAANPAAKLAGGVPATPTTGSSITGVSTSQDVSGRSGPTASAYSPTPGGGPSTSTSAAHGGTGTGSSTAGNPTGRTGMGAGMPIMPMMPGAGGGAGGPSGDRKTVAKFQTSDDVSILNGELTLAEAVGGYGTLCQKRD